MATASLTLMKKIRVTIFSKPWAIREVMEAIKLPGKVYRKSKNSDLNVDKVNFKNIRYTYNTSDMRHHLFLEF